jgi:hypothetical protein
MSNPHLQSPCELFRGKSAKCRQRLTTRRPITRNWRIALTVIALATFVPLITFGLRSHYWYDEVGVSLGRAYAYLASEAGRITVTTDPRGTNQPSLDFSNPLLSTRPRDANSPWQWQPAATGGVTASVPYWFPATLAALVAGLPWLRWKKYSLRGFLFTATLIAIAAGLIAATR